MKSKKFLPKVKFELSSPKLDADLLYNFSQSNWNKYVFKTYPELKVLLEGKSKKAGLKICNDFVCDEIIRKKKEITKAKKEITEDWNLVSKEFFEEISSHFETEWPKDKKVIKGYISIVPICPRFLDDYSFSISYLGNINRRVTVAHETLHFLWFKKWKEVFPKTRKQEFESPHLVWKLSEIIDPIILQCNPRLKKLINPKSWGYDEFKNIKIDEVSLSKHFAKIYKDSMKNKDSFGVTMNKLFAEAKKYESLLKF